MMKASRTRAAGVAAAVAALLAVGAATPAAADELSELRAAVQALQARLDQLEARAQTAEQTDDRQTDQIAMVRSSVGSWVPNFTFKGDLRYRNENIDQQYTAARNRDRIRARAGFVAKVNDTIRSEFSLATAEGNDPRSANQSLTGENSRKNVFLDLAYAEWQALPTLKFTAGKMKYPWTRAGASSLFDGDVNPEGLAANWARGDLFASGFWNQIEERAASGESTLGGGQIGWKPALGPGRLTIAAGYFDFNSVRRRNPFHAGGANGNTTVTTGCIGGATPCLKYDYDLMEAIADYATTAAGRPLSLYADFIQNDKAEKSLDTAVSVGFTWGRAADPRTWEIGYNFQRAEKDAVFAQYIDSDIGGGNTDYSSHIVRAGYAVAKNWVLNMTYILSETNMQVPVSIAGIGPVRDRDYERLQLDLNFKY